MAIKTDVELLAQVQAGITVNGNGEITPPIHKAIEDNIIASKLNIRDGGLVVESLTGYTTNLTPSDDKHWAPKKYVDDSIALAPGSVSSVFGRAGAVVAVLGDYTTAQVTEDTNLYFTNARVDSRVQAYTGDVTVSGTAFSIGASKVTNSMLAGSIAYSKLSLTGAILNADLAGSIAYSKLSLTGSIVNGDLAAAVSVAKGGNGLSTVASGSIIAYNTLDTASAITSTSGTKVLLNTAGTISWSTIGVTSFLDNAFTLQDNGDATKQLQFELSGISTGTTRTLTVPNVSDTLAVLGTAQTFSAKQTFTAATTEIASLTLLDTTYKTALDIQASGVLRFGNGFTTSNIATDIALGGTLDLYLSRLSANTLRISTSSAHSTMGNLEVAKITLTSGNTMIDSTISNVGLSIAGTGGTNTTCVRIATGSGVSGTSSVNYNLIMLGGTFASASGSPIQLGTVIAPIYNILGGTPSMVACRITPYLQATTGATSILLFDVGTNTLSYGTGTHTSYFNINSTGSVTLADSSNFILGTTTGTKWGTSTAQKQSFWGAIPIVQPSGANQQALTDSTTGTPSYTLVDVGASFSQANINNNISSIYRILNEYRNVLVNTGLMKGAA